MNLRDRIHKKLQQKALAKSIKQLIPDIGDYYINEKKLVFKVKDKKLELLQKLDFNLPSWEEIIEFAKTIYKNFDGTIATKIVYEFSYLKQEKDLMLSAKDSDIVLGYNNFTNLIIDNAKNVKIFANTIGSGGISINAQDIIVMGITCIINKDINLICESVLFYRLNLICLRDININSEFIEFDNSKIVNFHNLYLKSNLIVSENSGLESKNKIEITNTNCDEIKGVDAPVIIYNGQDITYSEGVVMPKLRKNLIEVLYKIRNKVSSVLDTELEEKTQKLKQELNNKPITKILKK